uniref:Vasoactive intestinal peptide receptor 2 n=1 Tax=Hippocampus comes TaxID=109280 RepID=A0A3Q2Y870_HIPCM
MLNVEWLPMADADCLFLIFFVHSEAGCKGTWDNITCWERTGIGQTATIPCPHFLRTVFGTNGNISRKCMASGWSEVFPNITSACGSDMGHDKLVFYMLVQTLYTLGHSLSLIFLTTGSAVLFLFRKLRCTRNSIHLNLFLSFILRAAAVLVKDRLLFGMNDGNAEMSGDDLVLLQYFIMANFFWLLVEALYLHTLLVAMFSQNTHFAVYMLIGWGKTHHYIQTQKYTGCIHMTSTHHVPLFIRVALSNHITLFPSQLVNFLLFIRIVRILVQKLQRPDLGGGDHSQYGRLAKSTLLLIPLFGIHYVVFVSLSESMAEDYKIFFDLALGSFQGLVVAILYCFLNSEVQSELKRKWRSLCMDCNLKRAQAFSATLVSWKGSEHTVHFQRTSRTQSILQSETTVL